MRIIKFSFTNGYVGGDVEECIIYPSSTTDSEIISICQEMQAEFAEDYAYLAHGYPFEVEEGGYFETEEEAEEALEDYYSYCECGWQEISLDELKDWCEGHYNEYEDEFAESVKEYTEKGL